MKPELQSLTTNRDVFENLYSGLTPEEYLWREHDGKWNLLEVICHLYDEEREDFRARVSSVLEDPAKPWPKIDPVAWVSERKYVEQDIKVMLDKFLNEREASITLLSSLKNPQWENAYQHPKVGPISARFLLVNWVAHDFLHIRQIIRIKYNYLKFTTGLGLDYAGEW